MRKAISIILCLVFVLGLCSCNSEEDYDTLELTAMNTVMQITVFNNSETDSQKVFDLMTDCIREIESLLDVNSPNSDISKINSSLAETEIIVNEHTAKILDEALSAYDYTHGLFDVRIMNVVSLWGFDNGKYGVPEDDKIKATLSAIEGGSFDVDVENSTVTKHGDVKLVVGGIAKGYLGDLLLEIAEEQNVNAIISLGGNIVLCGEKADGDLWSVGVKNPLDTEDIACSFESEGNLSVVTSGAYERYFEYGGETYHHIIDPSTGYPAESDLLSVTVIGEKGVVCDCLSTALYICGKEEAVEFAMEFNSYEFIFITADNEILYTNGIGGIELSSDAFSLKEIQR